MIRLVLARVPRPRRLLLVLSSLVVLGAAIGAWLLLRGDAPAAAAATTATVSTQTLKQTVTASGTVAAATTAERTFDISGTVTQVFVEPGDTVKKGQRLARVGDDILQAKLSAAESSLDAAEATQSEHLSAGASDEQLAADKTAVLAAQSSLTEARTSLRDAVLRSTIAGTVTDVGIAVGDTVGTGTGTGSAGGTPNAVSGADVAATANATDSASITVVSTGAFVVNATVPSSDVGKVKKGMQAEVTISGVDETVYGTVAEVGLVAETNSSGAAAFPVTIEITGVRKDLYAGTSADVAITVSQRADVLTVDSRAVHTDGDSTYVEKVDAATGKAVRTEVTTGDVAGMATEIVKGLTEGDVVQVPAFTGPGGGSGGNGRMGQGGFPDGFQPPEGFQPPSGGFPGGGFPGGGAR